MKSLGREPEDAIALLDNLQMTDTSRIEFEQFLQIMRELENKMIADKQAEEENEPKEATQQERQKYGVLLPRTGVHFLPDYKVVDFLRLLNDYRRKCEKGGELLEAKRAGLKFEDLRQKETLRQQQNMRQAQEQELVTVENAQR